MRVRHCRPLLRRTLHVIACATAFLMPPIGAARAELPTKMHSQSMAAKVMMALITSDVDQLERWFESYRTSRSRTPNGAWNLTELYSAMVESHHFPDDSQGLDLWKEFTSKWAKAHPRSPTPHVLLARLHYREAWKIRGGGYAHEVWDEDWSRFHAELKNARKVLLTTKEISARDPEWYAMMIAIGLELGEPSAKANALFEEAIRREPLYLPTLGAIMRAHSPRWGGDARTAAQIARRHSDRIGGDYGDAIYAFMFRMAVESVGGIDELKAAGFSLSRVEKGLREMVASAPSRSGEEYTEFMDLACSVESPKLLQATVDALTTATGQPREVMDFDYYCRRGEYAEPKPVIPPAPLLQDAAASRKQQPVPRQ